ncbi:4-phosphoerythronate dehydrogenase [Planctomycetota bacterium]
MKIVADENIAYVKDIFAPLGLIECIPGRPMTCGALKEADVLLVRSVTRVDADLLEGSAVRFVGTCTIGTDHIDLDYLKKRGIAFADAVGSNANSVAEYVLTAILVLARQKGWDLNGKTLGIIGVGNIGSIIEKKAPALGLKVLPNDPPLHRKTADPRFVSLDQALQADIISLHVPLTASGPDPTFHLLNENNLPRLKPHTVLINTSRGPVVDNNALKNCLTARTIGPTVLDVWENEPNIDQQLLDLVAIGTAHVAGYSLDGKANGAAMLHAAVCDFFNLTGKTNIAALLPTRPLAI